MEGSLIGRKPIYDYADLCLYFLAFFYVQSSKLV